MFFIIDKQSKMLLKGGGKIVHFRTVKWHLNVFNVDIFAVV